MYVMIFVSCNLLYNFRSLKRNAKHKIWVEIIKNIPFLHLFAYISVIILTSISSISYSM